jgi:hypothetical protein
MKSEQIKAITERATEQLIAALDAGHSETLNAYLKAIGRFYRYSLHNVMLIALQKPNPVTSPDSALGISWAVTSRRARRES